MERFEPKKEISENRFIQLADELDKLQEKENEGDGIGCVKAIVRALRVGDMKFAKTCSWNESDKLMFYPNIRKWIRENIFSGEEDYPWRITDEGAKRRAARKSQQEKNQ